MQIYKTTYGPHECIDNLLAHMVMVSAYFEDFALSTQLHHIARLPGLSWYSCVTLATLWHRDCGYLSPSSGHRISMFHVHTKLLQLSNIIHRRYRRAQKFVKSFQNILTFLPCQETFLHRKYTDRNRSTLGWRKKFGSIQTSNIV